MMNIQADKPGIKLGMWLFLYTEIMLFGGLFVLYAVYYSKYTAEFAAGGKDLETMFGAANTIILLFSSLLVAMSITALRKNSVSISIAMLFGAIACGIIFLINKYFEWSHKFDLGLYPNSPVLTDGEPGRNIFFGLYYTITGLHGVHIIIGLILLGFSVFMIKKGRTNADNYSLLDNAGLYWHLVDLIWIFVFPLFYLIL